MGHLMLMMEIEKEFELRFDVTEMSELDSFVKIENKLAGN
jgi:acyl carrier protein